MADRAPQIAVDRRVYAVILVCAVILVACLTLVEGSLRVVIAVIASYWLLWRLALLPFRGRKRSRWLLLLPVGVGMLMNHWAAPALAAVHGPLLVAMFGARRDYRPGPTDDRVDWVGIALVGLIEAAGLAAGVGIARTLGMPMLL